MGELKIIPFFSQGLATFTVGSLKKKEEAVAHLALFDLMASLIPKPAANTYGMKCCPATPDEARQAVETLKRRMPGVKIILTTRDDLVAQFGSLTLAKQTNVWHSTDAGFVRGKRTSLMLSVSDFSDYALACREVTRILGELQTSHDTIEAPYEELIAHPSVIYRKLFDFVGLAQTEVTWQTMEKVNPPAHEYIENYVELTRCLELLKTRNR